MAAHATPPRARSRRDNVAVYVPEVGVRVAQMGVQPVLAGEGLAARAAHKRFVAGVDATVPAPLGLVAEEFAAKRAVVHGPPAGATLPGCAALQKANTARQHLRLPTPRKTNVSQ